MLIKKLTMVALSVFVVMTTVAQTTRPSDKKPANSESRSRNSNNNIRLTVEDFFSAPEKIKYRISPDGTRLAYIGFYKNYRNLFVQNIGDAASIKNLTQLTDAQVEELYWLDNDYIVFTSVKTDGTSAVHSVKISSGEVLDHTPLERVIARVIDPLPGDISSVLIEMNKRDPRVFDVYKLNVKMETSKLIAQNPGNVVAWHPDHDGRVALATAVSGEKNSLLYRTDLELSNWTELLTWNYAQTFKPLFYAFEGNKIYATSNLGRERQAIVLFDLSSKKELETVHEHYLADVERLYFSPKRKMITYAEVDGDRLERLTKDKSTMNLFRLLQVQVPDAEMVIENYNTGEDKIVVRAFADNFPDAYYLYDTNGNRLTLLSKSYPALPNEKMLKTEPLQVTASDNSIIYCYLTLPQNGASEGLPLVVLTPADLLGNTKWGFDPTVQFLANRGYAVLQVNPRSSSGFGPKYAFMGYKNLLQATQNDITDAVYYLVKRGKVNERKIAIMGGYYAALASGTIADLFACSIFTSPVVNLFSHFNATAEHRMLQQEQLYAKIGSPLHDEDLVRNESPITWVDRMMMPILLAHGDKDTEVDYFESKQLLAEFNNRGKKVEQVSLMGEGHQIRSTGNRVNLYKSIELFLARYLLQDQ